MGRPRPDKVADKVPTSTEDLAKQIIENGQRKNFKELEKIIETCDQKALEKTVSRRIERADVNIFWNFLLIGFKSNSESITNKRFAVIMAMLNEINKVEIASKQSFELVTRIFIELPKLRPSELINLCEYCTDSMRMGDPKCLGWKELLPELMRLLSSMPKLMVLGEAKSGAEYCDSIVRNLLSLKWPNSVLTGIASMFLEMQVSKNDKFLVLNKLCENIMEMEPENLASLAFQLFSMCSTPAQLMVPMFALNKYFQKYYYQKLFDEMDSDQQDLNSIDRFSDVDLLAAQNTILYHLNNCSEYKISEKEVVQQFKALASNPKYILTPFLTCALLTISNISRYLESSRLSISHVLPFMRSVIQNNEKERELCQSSAWFRDTLEHSAVDVNKMYSVLLDQCKEDIFTPGLVAMAFVLLKAAQYSSVNIMGMHFLEELVKKRYQLGNGVVSSLKGFLLANQDVPQYAECLARLSIANTMMVSECYAHIKEILDYFLLIPGHHAMRMMTFILPLIKNNAQIRDYFIDILRRAMYQSNLSTRQMGVHGFCLILKQQRNNNSHRPTSHMSSFNGSQLSISGFSMMSQHNLNSGKNPNLNFDMCVLEIIGILRKCFNQTYEIKEILYDGLLNAVQQNTKLISHVVQFLEWHLRNYFEDVENDLTIKFNKCISETNTAGVSSIQLNDHLGKLLHFMVQCIILVDYHDLEVETADLREFFDLLVENLTKISMEKLGLTDALTPMTNNIGQQFLNCLEGLMYYCLRIRNLDDQNVLTIIRIFHHHQACSVKLQEASMAAKKTTRKKTDDCEPSGNVRSILSAPIFKPSNIWDLSAVHSFLEAICREPYETNLLREQKDLCTYVLKATSAHVESMRLQPEYKQIKYSKSSFKYLTDISALLLKHFMYSLMEIIDTGDIDIAIASVESFQECLATAIKLYCRKLPDFLKVLPISSQIKGGNNVNTNLINGLQDTVNRLMQSFENNDVAQPAQAILLKLLQCLEMLYDNINLTEFQAKEVQNWLCGYCKSYNVEDNSSSIIHKLYFSHCIRTQNGPIFEKIAKQIEYLYGQIEEEEITDATELKSVNASSAEACINQLCDSVKKQIEDVEFFILKVKGYFAQMKIGGQSENDLKECEQRMLQTERRICSQLIFISRVCIHLANACLPLGPCMDNFLKLVTHYYICLANLARHFVNRQKLIGFSLRHTKFDQLVQTVGKKLPMRIYAIVSYIEDNIDGETTETANKKSTKNPKNEKAKVMRDTKFIPKLIWRIENFNKYVIWLSKKTEHDLAKFLHIGTVRDFRIKTNDLRKAIEETLVDSENISIGSDDENGDQSEEGADEDIDIIEEVESNPTPTDNTSGSIPSGSTIKDIDCTTSSAVNVLKNLATINKKVSKRKVVKDDEKDDSNNKKKKSTRATETTRRSKRNEKN